MDRAPVVDLQYYTNLRDSDAALPGQLLLRLFWRVRVAQVRVEIFVQDFRRLLTEVSSLPSVKQSLILVMRPSITLTNLSRSYYCNKIFLSCQSLGVQISQPSIQLVHHLHGFIYYTVNVWRTAQILKFCQKTKPSALWLNIMNFK